MGGFSDSVYKGTELLEGMCKAIGKIGGKQ